MLVWWWLCSYGIDVKGAVRHDYYVREDDGVHDVDYIHDDDAIHDDDDMMMVFLIMIV